MGRGSVGGDRILLMASKTSLLCSGEPTAETKSMLDETVEQIILEDKTPQGIAAARFGSL